MGLTIAQMQLAPVARRGAEALQAACPWVVFTSGRRDVEDQARAMAVNVSLRRDWISRTYLRAGALQSWVDRNPQAVTVEQLTDGLHDALLRLPDAEVAAISRHLTGDAFDVRPLVGSDGTPTTYGQTMLDVMRNLSGVDRILVREGGLTRWHIQFIPSIEA